MRASCVQDNYRLNHFGPKIYVHDFVCIARENTSQRWLEKVKVVGITTLYLIGDGVHAPTVFRADDSFAGDLRDVTR